MRMNNWTADRRAFAPEGDAAAAGADDAAATVAASAAAAAADAQAAPNPKWWEGDKFADPARLYLTAKGLTVDDPLEAMPKLIDIAANAEKRIGRGLDSIIDKPGKDQPYSEWVAANRAALGLPADEAAYKIAPPESWPKDLPWDTAGEGKARSIALKYGIPDAALQELVALQASTVMDVYGSTAAMSAKALADMMNDLERDFGTQTPVLMNKAKQAAQLVAEKAGLSTEALANLSDAMREKIGDANVIRFMGSIADMMSDDAAVGMGKGGSMTTTPAEARQQLAVLRDKGGDFYQATYERNETKLAQLRPVVERLSRIAAGG